MSIDYGNSSNRRGETRLGDIIHNKVDYLKKYQAVPKEELEQMIVFPGNKRAESSQAAD